MIDFQRRRSDAGRLTAELLAEGHILFKYLEQSVTTHELQMLIKSYQRQLDFESKGWVEYNNEI